MRLPCTKKQLWLFLAITILLIATLTYTTLNYWHQANAPTTPETIKSSEIEPDNQPTEPSRSLSFAAMGDMLAHDSVVNQAKTADGYDFTRYFSSIKPLYTGSDVVFCNPETPVAGAKFGINGYPTFNAPTEFARDLSKSGCNLINLASNHMTDKGQEALSATIDEWRKQDILAVSGASKNIEDQQKVSYFEKNGLKVAFLAFADFSNGPIPHPYSLNLYHDKPLVEKLLSEARQQADVVIVSAHWGTEDSHAVNQDQIAAAKLFNKLGADVIIGTGPHVLQKVDMLKRPDGHQTLVWYSIGNMLSSQLQVNELTGGIAKFKLSKAGGKLQFSDLEFQPTFMSYRWSAADKAADRLDKRKDLKLLPLRKASSETQLFGASTGERYDKIREWLKGSAELKIL